MRYALSVLNTQCFTFGLIYIYSARARHNKGIIFIPPPAHFSWVSTPPRNSTSPTCVISASHAPPITNMRGWVSQSLSYAQPPPPPHSLPLSFLSYQWQSLLEWTHLPKTFEIGTPVLPSSSNQKVPPHPQ